FQTAVMHGNRTQNQRQRSLEQFRHGKINTLIATDVAARGIDVDNISHVINYDLPESYDTYIHRIGRTGRVDKKGIALTFIG
ncbi:DEAD/DEAH box helicase, partial [Candidatus Woesebacteria bacterium]